MAHYTMASNPVRTGSFGFDSFLGDVRVSVHVDGQHYTIYHKRRAVSKELLTRIGYTDADVEYMIRNNHNV